MSMLITAWFLIIAFCVIMYVLLDGFDLGIGILFPFFSNQQDRNILVSTILPVWDGNQTWLVLGGACFYGAFPLAFSLLLPALYMPLFIMILALLLRGITFEFRLKAARMAYVWDWVFFLGSAIATFCQGLILGTFVKGFDRPLTGAILQYHLFTPFNVMCGVSLLFGYALLGATWGIAKTNGTLQQQLFKITQVCLIVIVFALGIISLWSPFIDQRIANIWFNPEYMMKLASLPLITGGLIVYFFICLHKKCEYILFWLSIGIFICSYIGFGISTWPYLIPPLLPVWNASAPESSLLFMLFGALILLPVLVGYTFYSYYIFRGKVKEALEY